jgi:hypothetical protein
VRHSDNTHPGFALLLDDLIAKRLHPGPMHLWAEMVLRVKSVVEPRPVIKLAVGAHTPGNRLVWIAAVVPVITVQIREAVSKIPKRKKETDVMPVENTKDHKCCNEAHQLEHSPKRLARVLAFQFLEDGLGILAKETDKRVFQRMFRFTLMAVLVNRNPIDRVAMIVGPVGVSLVMLHVNAFVKNLPEANRDRFHDAEQAIQQRRTEIGIVNEVVGNAVDVPRNADRINKTENQHHPQRNARKKVKHAKEVNTVQNSCRDRDDVPARVRKDPGICLWTLDRGQISRRSSHCVQEPVLEYTIFA